MSLPMRREARGTIPELFDWLEAPLYALRPSARGFRVEELVHDGRYVVRAELPGIDPESDAEVSVAHGVLTIRAERKEEHKEHHRSEFTYGSMVRAITLPAGVDEENVEAAYENGVLTVSFAMAEPKKAGRTIAIKRG